MNYILAFEEPALMYICACYAPWPEGGTRPYYDYFLLLSAVRLEKHLVRPFGLYNKDGCILCMFSLGQKTLQ